jgi:hypothetical protein
LLALLRLLAFFSLGWAGYSVPAGEIGKILFSYFHPVIFQNDNCLSAMSEI